VRVGSVVFELVCVLPAVIVSDTLCEPERVRPSVNDSDFDSPSVIVADTDCDSCSVIVCVRVGRGVSVSDDVTVIVGRSDIDADAVHIADCVRETDSDGEADTVLERVGPSESDCDCVLPAVTVFEAVAPAVIDCVRDVRPTVNVALGWFDGESEIDAVTVCDRLFVNVGVSVAKSVTVLVRVLLLTVGVSWSVIDIDIVSRFVGVNERDRPLVNENDRVARFETVGVRVSVLIDAVLRFVNENDCDARSVSDGERVCEPTDAVFPSVMDADAESRFVIVSDTVCEIDIVGRSENENDCDTRSVIVDDCERRFVNENDSDFQFVRVIDAERLFVNESEIVLVSRLMLTFDVKQPVYGPMYVQIVPIWKLACASVQRSQNSQRGDALGMKRRRMFQMWP